MTMDQLVQIRELCLAVVDAVKAAGEFGAPGGVLYAAMAAHGCSLDQFNAIMSGLVLSGRLVQRGQSYFVAEVVAK